MANSRQLTAIELPGIDRGFADWGSFDPDEMIATYREQARQKLAEAQAVLDASDEDFRVITYVGPVAMNGLKVLRPGRKVPPRYGDRRSARLHPGRSTRVARRRT